MAGLTPNKIIVHHSLTEDSGTVSWGAIRAYHKEIQKWKDIGYHAGIEQVLSGGLPYYEALIGRIWDEPGAHTRGHNHDSLAICFIGNFDKSVPGRELLDAGAAVIAYWLRIFNLTIEDIYGHRDFNPAKSCPGKNFDMDRLKMIVGKI